MTGCLGCADLHRRDRDAAWPAVAAQLRDTVGVADRATLLATAALAALNEVGGSDSEPRIAPITRLTWLTEAVGGGSNAWTQMTRQHHVDWSYAAIFKRIVPREGCTEVSP